MAKKNESKAAIENWINVNAETRDVYKRYGYDFCAIFSIAQHRIINEGLDKYINLSDKEIDELCKKADEENEKSKEPDENGVIHLSVWQGYNERDTITMIKAFANLSSEDKHTILGAKSFFDAIKD